jgi:amino acid transporter
MSSSVSPDGAAGGLRKAARVIVVGSVLFSFISYWRTAAVVLCDLGSTAYYIGGIVEQSIGAAAPWFILAVMLFSYAVRSVYIESCSLFVRGGVYRVVKEALGRFCAKLAVSALIFDYLLTGPISGVSAGHYLMGLVLDTLRIFELWVPPDVASRDVIKAWGAVAICIAATLYFYRLNIIGIHESSDRALKIMYATTIMVVVMLVWCGLTLAINGVARDTQTQQRNRVPFLPELSKKPDKLNEVTNLPEPQPDPIGFLGGTAVGEKLRPENIDWLSLFGAMAVMIAFGHSILAMSGEETLAQVYREVESPKLQNFRKAAFIVFIYSLVFTAGISFLAVLLIPADLRVSTYSENLISGLAMHVYGREEVKLALNAFVVVVGFLILSGAVNTAIIGSNGVLNRVAEDGVLPEWFLKPHARYGTTYRLLTLIVGLQIAIILLSRGDVLLLGEAYAFGVVWSFVFQAVSMVVLRFKDPRPREYKVPFNLRIGGVEIPFGLLFVLVVLFAAAVLNLLTKELATISGLSFTAIFFTIFLVSEYYHDRKLKGGHYQHLEQFNEAAEEEITPKSLGLTLPYRKLVSIRSPYNLFMLEKALAETDPTTTEVIVMTAKTLPEGGGGADNHRLDTYDQELMTAVVQKAEMAGKPVHPLLLPTNNAIYAILRMARDLHVQELVVGASNKYTADEQIDLMVLYWVNLNGGNTAPLTVRILGKDRDLYFDIGGGNRIPKHAERRARSVGDLRKAGVGVDHVLLVHEDSSAGLDLYQAVLTMLDPTVELALLVIPDAQGEGTANTVRAIEEQSAQLDRRVTVALAPAGPLGPYLVREARERKYDLLVLALPAEMPHGPGMPLAPWLEHVLRNAPCRVFLAAQPPLPQELAE